MLTMFQVFYKVYGFYNVLTCETRKQCNDFILAMETEFNDFELIVIQTIFR